MSLVFEVVETKHTTIRLHVCGVLYVL